MFIESDSDLISEEKLRSAINIVGAQAVLKSAYVSIRTIPNSWSASVLLMQPLHISFFIVSRSEALLIDWPNVKSVAGTSRSFVRFRNCFDGFIWLLAHECRHIDQFINPNLLLIGACPEVDADDWAYKKLAEWQRTSEPIRRETTVCPVSRPDQ